MYYTAAPTPIRTVAIYSLLNKKFIAVLSLFL